MSNNISSIAYNLIKDDLDVSALRNKVIANNISNINTAGYKRKYVSFEDTLQNKIRSVSLKSSSEKHILRNIDTSDKRIITDNSTSTRSDGNNVDIDTEIVNLTANNMMYESLTTALNSRFAMNKIARGN